MAQDAALRFARGGSKKANRTLVRVNYRTGAEPAARPALRNYEVVWDDQAIDELQRLIDIAHDREGLANVVTRIGLELSARPSEAGESRELARRILFKFPLIVRFAINERLKSVLIRCAPHAPRLGCSHE